MVNTVSEFISMCQSGDRTLFLTKVPGILKGTTINDLGGGRRKSRKKNLGSPSPGKNKSQKAFPRIK